MATSFSSSLTSSASASAAIKWAIGSWSLFIAENVILSENRTQLIAYLGGDDNYHVFYGSCSSFAVGSILYAYRYKIRGVGPRIWTTTNTIPWPARMASFILHSIGLGMASQSFPKLQIPIHYNKDTMMIPRENSSDPTSTKGRWKVRCPFDFSDKYSQTAAPIATSKNNDKIDTESSVVPLIQGLDRITRHPGLWAFACIGVGNALLVKSIPTQIWFSMPLAVATIGGYHTDSRYRRGLGGYLSPAMEDRTSSIPFWAIFSNKQGDWVTVLETFWKDEFKGLNATAGVGIAALWVLRRTR